MKTKKLMSKRHFVLSALVLALAAAVYLNWEFASADGGLFRTGTSSEPLGTATYVNASGDNETDDEPQGYFATARSDREKARNDKIAELNEIINNAKAADDDVKKATQEQIAVADSIEKEANIETLVKAKGFDDCVAVISGDAVSVIVKSKEDLLASETMQIVDIATSQSGVSAANIKILTYNE